MLEIPIFDIGLAHQGCIVPGKPGDKIRWIYGMQEKEAIANYQYVCYTDNFIMDKLSNPPDNAIAMITESPSMSAELYDKCLGHPNSEDFIYFLTPNTKFSKFCNWRWIPGQGVWVGGDNSGETVGIKEKIKNISMMTSDKMLTPMHRTRVHIAKTIMGNYRQYASKVDIHGSINGYQKKVRGLEDYMFSIVVENGIHNSYFTEKILNCFAVGTIPIYLGAPNISEFFDLNGILQCNTSGEIFDTLDELTNMNLIEFYNSRLDAIERNFDRAMEYNVVENYIWENYFK